MTKGSCRPCGRPTYERHAATVNLCANDGQGRTRKKRDATDGSQFATAPCQNMRNGPGPSFHSTALRNGSASMCEV